MSAMNEFKIADPLLRKIVYALGVMGVIAVGFYTFSLLRDAIDLVFRVLTPFLLALILAYIMAPIVIGLQQRLKLGRVMGTLALYLIILLVFAAFLAILIPNLIAQALRLIELLKIAVPQLLDRLSQYPQLNISPERLQEFKLLLQQRLSELDYEQIGASLLPALNNLASGGFSAAGGVAAGIFSGVGAVIGFISFLIFVGIINFYLILDWEKIDPMLRKQIPPQYRAKTFDTLAKIDTAVGGFLRGQLTVSIIVGSLFAAGLFLMGFLGYPALRNYSILIGTAAAIGGFIPYLGAIIGVTPALLIVLLTPEMPVNSKLITVGCVLALFAAIQALEGFVLQPRIVGKSAGLHPLVVLLALLAGAQFGIGGMIIAVPVASIARVLVREFYWLPIAAREAALPETARVQSAPAKKRRR